MSLEILALPVSGGYFVTQGAITAKLMEARTNLSGGAEFDLHFGASGGNLISMVASLFSESSESIQKYIQALNSQMFVRNHFQGKMQFLPSFIAGLLKQSGIYKTGKDAEKYVEEYFDKDFFTKTGTPEIWNLTFNVEKELGTLNCTKASSGSILSSYLEANDLIEFGIGEINYRGGDTDLIALDVAASASIPGIRQPVKIGGYSYKDGGLSRGSPASYFNEAIQAMRNAGSHSGAFHICYVLGSKLKSLEIGSGEEISIQRHWIKELAEDVTHLTTSSIYADKQSTFENWLRAISKRRSQCTTEVMKDVTVKNLKSKFDELDSKHYFMTFYTTKNIKVNITNFGSDEIRKKFEEAFDDVNVEIFYVDV